MGVQQNGPLLKAVPTKATEKQVPRSARDDTVCGGAIWDAAAGLPLSVWEVELGLRESGS